MKASEITQDFLLQHRIMNRSGFQIGNLIYDSKGELTTVEEDFYRAFRQPKMNHYYGYSAIPLTPQWLLAAGFEKCESGVSYTAWVTKNGLEKAFVIIDKNGVFTVNISSVLYELKHVHRLQNVYSFTGHELEFDLTKIETHE